MPGPLGTGSYNGLNWGPVTKIHLSSISGVDDLPPIGNSDQELAFDDGALAGHDRLQARHVLLGFVLVGDTPADYDSLVRSLQNATVRQDADLALLLFNSTRLLNVRPQRRGIVYEADRLARTGSAVVEFKADDPRVYDATLTQVSTGLAAVSGGMTFNATFPLTFGATGGGGTVSLTNAGNYPTPLTFSLAGPVTNPIIDNQTTGLTLSFLITLGGSDTLVIANAGTSKASIVLNGTASRRNALIQGSAPLQQFGLAPGTSTFRYRNNGAFTASTCQISARSAWV